MDILNKMEQDFDDKFSNKLDFLVRNFGVISQKIWKQMKRSIRKL